MRFILHIGQHKTGTTSIQYCLKAHAAAFRQQGFIVPASGRDNSGSQLPLILALEGEDCSAAIADLRREVSNGLGDPPARSPARRLREGSISEDEPTVLMSTERMFVNVTRGAFPRILDRLREAGATRFTLVMYLRSPYHQVNSLYAHGTAMFALAGADIAGFAGHLTAYRKGQTHPHFAYDPVIAVARREDVELVLKPYDSAVAKAVFPDFVRTIGAALPPTLDSVKLNTAFGPASLEAMRIVAGELGKLGKAQVQPLRAFASAFAKSQPEERRYWGIDDTIVARLGKLHDQTEKLAQFAWNAPWRDVIGDERRELSVFDPKTADARERAIHEGMLSGLRQVARQLPA